MQAKTALWRRRHRNRSNKERLQCCRLIEPGLWERGGKPRAWQALTLRFRRLVYHDSQVQRLSPYLPLHLPERVLVDSMLPLAALSPQAVRPAVSTAGFFPPQ
jgi:hypothetical protein